MLSECRTWCSAEDADLRRLIAGEEEARCYSGVMIIQIRNNLRHHSPARRTLAPFLMFSFFFCRSECKTPLLTRRCELWWCLVQIVIGLMLVHMTSFYCRRSLGKFRDIFEQHNKVSSNLQNGCEHFAGDGKLFSVAHRPIKNLTNLYQLPVPKGQNVVPFCLSLFKFLHSQLLRNKARRVYILSPHIPKVNICLVVR